MTIRVQYLDGARWRTIGLDCLDMSEARAALAMAPQGSRTRIVTREG